MPPKPVIKWTLQSSHTEHEQHKLRLQDLLARPAMIHEVQDKEMPQIIRAKVVLSGLRSSEQERHWQVELARHKQSVTSIRHKAALPEVGNAPAENPFSLRRFKVAAEIETQNDRILHNLHNVKPTVATAAQCKADAEVRRRARRHFQRYPTPLGPPTVPQDSITLDDPAMSPSNTARAARLAPMFPEHQSEQRAKTNQQQQQQQSDAHANTSAGRKNKRRQQQRDEEQQAAQHAATARSLTYIEQLDRRERGWDCTTQIVYAHPRSRQLATNVCGPISLPPSLLRGGNEDEEKQQQQQQQRQIQDRLGDSSGSDDDEKNNNEKNNDLSVHSSSVSSPRSPVATQPTTTGGDAAADRHALPQSTTTTTTTKVKHAPRPPPKGKQQQQQQQSGRGKSPSQQQLQHQSIAPRRPNNRVSFLSAIKFNPIVTDMKLKMEEAARRDAERRCRYTQEEEQRGRTAIDDDEVLERRVLDSDRAAEYKEIRRREHPEEFVDEEEEKKKKKLAEAEAKLQAELLLKQQQEEEERQFSEEFWRRHDAVMDFEVLGRKDVVRAEEQNRSNIFEAEVKAQRLAVLAQPSRVLRFFLQNRAPVNLVRRLVLLRAKRSGRCIARFLCYAASRELVLTKAIVAAETSKKLEEQQEIARKAVEEAEQKVEVGRRIDIAQPMAKKSVDTALRAREVELRREQDAAQAVIANAAEAAVLQEEPAAADADGGDDDALDEF